MITASKEPQRQHLGLKILKWVLILSALLVVLILLIVIGGERT